MTTFRDVVNNLDITELKKIKHDLDTGGKHISLLIADKVKELETKPMSACVVCGKSIEIKHDNFTLLFGPDHFRRKATFCAQDCLDYFLSRQKTVGQEQ